LKKFKKSLKISFSREK